MRRRPCPATLASAAVTPLAGEGTISIFTRGQQQAAAIRTGDAVPIQLSEIHSVENNGPEPLELMAVGVGRDTHKELEFVDANLGGPDESDYAPVDIVRLFECLPLCPDA